MLFNSISPPFYPKDIKKSVSNHLAGLLTYSSFCALPGSFSTSPEESDLNQWI